MTAPTCAIQARNQNFVWGRGGGLLFDSKWTVVNKQSDWEFQVNNAVKGALLCPAQHGGRGITPENCLKNNEAIWCVLVIFIV